MQVTLAREVLEFARTIRLSHSLFALPFALGAAWLAEPPYPEPKALALIVLCMVAARTAAMGMNRAADAESDARNERTANRAIPSGRLRRGTALALSLASGAAFMALAWGFWLLRRNPWPGLVAPLILAVLLGYPYTKRFTVLTHWILGLCLGLSPVGAWVALRGSLAAAPVLIGAAVTFWTAGFDILYAVQDTAFDRREGLRSIPARFGRRAAFHIALASHLAMLGLLAGFIVTWPYRAGRAAEASLHMWVVLGLLVAVQHVSARYVKREQVPPIIFRLSALMSILWMGGVICDVLPV